MAPFPVAIVTLDGVDVSAYVVEGSVTQTLNGIGQAQVKMQMASPFYGAAGSYLKVFFLSDHYGLMHHGRVLTVETTGDSDTGYTVYNSSDPLELWAHRPVRNPPGYPLYNPDPGNFSQPTIITDLIYGPQIVQGMMDGSEFNTIPQDSEGPLRLSRGSFAGGTVDLSGVPADWPMTMMQLLQLLVSTGVVDVVITPLDSDGPAGADLCQIDVYNGDYGQDKTSDVVYEYGTGSHNIKSFRWSEDMTTMNNKLWYYLGPRIDPEHWQASITADDPGLPDPPQTDIIARRDASRTAYDVRMDISIFDSVGEDAVMPKQFYYRLWQLEQWLRAIPRTLVHITPMPTSEIINTYEIIPGDLISVTIDSSIRGGITGAQRVYSITYSWTAEDSVITVGELQTSADQEGFQS